MAEPVPEIDKPVVLLVVHPDKDTLRLNGLWFSMPFAPLSLFNRNCGTTTTATPLPFAVPV